MRSGWVAIAFLISVLSISSAHAEKRVALVIGIDAYDNLEARAQLKKARSDAGAIGRALRDLGFEVIAADDLTRSTFNETWTDFLGRLEPGDTAALFFAGHGVEIGGRNYLLPRDVPNIRPGREELLKRESLSLQEFLEDLREKKTRLNVVILDACRDNPFTQLSGRSVGRSRGLVATEPPEGTFILYSAGTGESALDRLHDDDKNANSIFTRQLLPLLQTRGMSLTDLAKDIRLGVRKMAASVDHVQTPAYYDQVIGRACLASCGAVRSVPRFRVSSAGPDAAKEGNTLLAMEVSENVDAVRSRRVYANNRLVFSDEFLPAAGRNLTSDVISIPVAKGENIVRVALSNIVGEHSESMSIKQYEEGSLDRPGTLHILAIGIDNYQTLPKLQAAGADARLIAKAFEKNLKDEYAKVVMRVLTDQDSTFANIMRWLDFLRTTESNDTTVIFVAGHALADGATYRFLPVDAEYTNKVTGMWDIDKLVRSTTITGQMLQEAIETAKGIKLLFLDTVDAASAFNNRFSGSVITYASSHAKQDSIEHHGHGIFTNAIVEGLNGRAVDAKGRITTKSLASYASERVIAVAKRHFNMEQEPQYFSGSGADEEFVLVPRARNDTNAPLFDANWGSPQIAR